MNRPKYQTKHIMLVGSMQKETAKLMIDNAPMDAAYPIEVVIREQVKTRGLDANAAMWAGALKDISEQAWYKGKQYSAEVWHDLYKRLFLVEQYTEGITKEGYEKWTINPHGDRILIGSTTQLTVRGFSEYLEQVHADGASMGVKFHTVRQS